MDQQTKTRDIGIDVNTGKPAHTSAGRLFGFNTIHGPDGPYMTRIWIGRLRLHIFHRGDLDEDCHDHPWDFWTFPLTPYVEEVIDLVIGEEPTKFRQVVTAWRLSFRPAEHCHRVLGGFSGNAWSRSRREIVAGIRPRSIDCDPDLEPYFDCAAEDAPSRIITLVWVSKRKRDWGFLKNRDGSWCWVAWRDYVFGGGKRGPCE